MVKDQASLGANILIFGLLILYRRMLNQRARRSPNSLIIKSGKRGSNPRPSAWEADALPLSYSRL